MHSSNPSIETMIEGFPSARKNKNKSSIDDNMRDYFGQSSLGALWLGEIKLFIRENKYK